MANMAAININFDSIRWNLSLNPKFFRDPSFFHIADRFFDYAQKYCFKYTIFIIGEDLENPEVASRVRDWHQMGHEIGNHSYNHKQNLGYLPVNEIEKEVMKSHDLILQTCGEEPKGFIAPAWATSKNLVKVLIKNRYLYDTSSFPSYFMWLANAKIYWRFRNDPRGTTVLQRHDRLANLLGSRNPFFTDGTSLIKNSKGGLLVIPLPVSSILRIPIWHTMAFLMPEHWFERFLKSAVQFDFFYYLMHPADLADLEDVPKSTHKKLTILERIEIPLVKKGPLVEKYLHLIKSQSRRMVTLKTMAEEIISQHKELAA